MSEHRLLSRVTLRRDAPIAALRSILLPDGDDRRMMAAHQLIWTLFGDARDRARDFLWRDAGEGRFYILSARAPLDVHEMFQVDEPKPFAPVFAEGDRLSFVLRANATIARRVEGGKRGKAEDVVMHALHALPKGPERASARAFAVQTAGHDWLQSQGVRCGFALAQVAVDGAVVTSHRTLRVDHKGQAMTIGVMDFSGTIIVADPVMFAEALRDGFGRAKAFGCGLMLVRRA